MPNLRNIELKPKYTIQENSYNDINFEKRTNMFKGTIIICVAYGIVAFLLMLSTAFSNSARIVLFNNFLPFTLVFIIGTILIICLMVYFIFSYIPVNMNYRLDGLTCPDYWDVELLNDNYINNSFDPSYPSSFFKYKCVMNKDIFDKKRMFIDSYDSLSNQYKSNAYKYTNILDSLRYSTEYDGLAGTYDVRSNTYLENDLEQLKDYAKLYKDVNKYTIKDIQKYIDTNSETLSSNILSNLKNIALIQNNYKKPDYIATRDYIDLISTSNLLWNSSKSASPITWNYSTNISNSVGIADTALSVDQTTSPGNIKAIILDWKDLTPEKAFYNGYEDTTNSNLKYLNIYYNHTSTDLALLGKVEITSNSSNNPTISMKFKSDVLGKFYKTDSLRSGSEDFIINPSKIIISKFEASDSDLRVSSGKIGLSLTNANSMNINDKNKPIIQLYDDRKSRPYTISSSSLTTNPIPLNCDELYPSLLESIDDNNNSIRCSYSKICGIPWSDLRCHLEEKRINHPYYTPP